MNSPFDGNFQVTQTQHSAHDGLDLVGLDSNEVHATVTGTVRYAGWENDTNHSQGFGLYVCIRGSDGYYYYYGHLSKKRVNTGDKVKICDVIGIMGNTGYSTGAHTHYCVRKQFAKGNELNTPLISGIPNALGVYNDGHKTMTKNTHKLILTLDGVKIFEKEF